MATQKKHDPLYLLKDEEFVRRVLQPHALGVHGGLVPMTVSMGIKNASDEDAKEAVRLMKQAAKDYDNVLAFAVPTCFEDGDYSMIYTTEPWVADLLAWTYAEVALEQRHQIIGLLLGFSPQFIAGSGE